jgi:hypothetical protein
MLARRRIQRCLDLRAGFDVLTSSSHAALLEFRPGFNGGFNPGCNRGCSFGFNPGFNGFSPYAAP